MNKLFISDNDNKRDAVLKAAMLLLVEKGDARCVSTRMIVERAGASKTAIDWYFGGKAGLFEVVRQELRKVSVGKCLETYFQMHKALLKNHDGQVEFVTGMLDAFQAFFQRKVNDPWLILLRQRVIQSYYEVGADVFGYFMESDVNAFYQVYRIITGRDSADEAYAWFMCIMLPLSTRSFRKHKMNFYGTQTALSPDFDTFFLESCKRKLLVGWGLAPFTPRKSDAIHRLPTSCNNDRRFFSGMVERTPCGQRTYLNNLNNERKNKNGNRFLQMMNRVCLTRAIQTDLSM